jgi:hypothetical protein
MGGRIVIESAEQHAAWVQQHSAVADAGTAAPDSTAAPTGAKN